MSYRNKQSQPQNFSSYKSTNLGGEDSYDSTGRFVSSSHQRAQEHNNFGEVYRIYSKHARSKQMIAWYKSFNIGTATFDHTTDTWTATDHYLENGDRVVLSSTGSLPTGFSAGTTTEYGDTSGDYYYIINPTSTTFQLSETRNGSSVDASSNGTGSHTFTIVPKLKAWCGWHYLPNDVGDPISPHDHWSIETPDDDGLLRTRLEVRAHNADQTTVSVVNANFIVSGGGQMGIGGTDGNTKKVVSYTTSTPRIAKARWAAGGSSGSETGSNAGSDYQITRFNDNGDFIAHVLHILRSNGNIGIGSAETTPTARMHFGAGTAGAGTAPIKLTAGTNMTTPENGAFEFDGTNLYFTSGGSRKTITMV